MPNIFEPHFDEPRKHPGFDLSARTFGRQAGAERWARAYGTCRRQAAYPCTFITSKWSCSSCSPAVRRCARRTAGATLPDRYRSSARASAPIEDHETPAWDE